MIKVGQTWRNKKGWLMTVERSHLPGYFVARREHTTDVGYRVLEDGRSASGFPWHDLIERVVRIYIAGPMTGYPDDNYPAFHAAAAHYRALGNLVISPAELHPKGLGAPVKEWGEYMRVDLAALMTCEMIVMLPGWTASKGARLEHHNARELDFAIGYPANELPTKGMKP